MTVEDVLIKKIKNKWLNLTSGERGEKEWSPSRTMLKIIIFIHNTVQINYFLKGLEEILFELNNN
jgi:hypothetical protein